MKKAIIVILILVLTTVLFISCTGNLKKHYEEDNWLLLEYKTPCDVWIKTIEPLPIEFYINGVKTDTPQQIFIPKDTVLLFSYDSLLQEIPKVIRITFTKVKSGKIIIKEYSYGG